MKKQTIGFILMTISAVGLAAATIIMKVMLQDTSMSPVQIAFWRFTIAAPLMWLIYVLQRPSSGFLTERPLWLIGLGVVYSLASFSALFALNRLSSSLYVIIVYIYPSLVVIFSLLTGRSIPRLYWLGLPITFLGLIFTAYDFRQAIAVDTIGVFITIINAVAMAGYVILSEKVFKKVKDRLLGTNWVLTGAMLVGLILIPVMKLNTPNSPYGWLLLISLCIFGTLVPILTMNIGLQLTGAARGSMIITLHPVFTVLFSMLFLAEVLTPQQWVGGVLVLAAVILLQQSSDRIGKKGDSHSTGKTKAGQLFE